MANTKRRKLNYQNVKTFKELAETIQEYIDRHKVPCQDSTTGEMSMQLLTSLSTTDARLAFIRLKSKVGLDIAVPSDLITLIDSCNKAAKLPVYNV